MIGTVLLFAGTGLATYWALTGNASDTLESDVQAWLNACRAGKNHLPAILVMKADPTAAPALEKALPPGYDGILVLTPGDWILYQIVGGKRIYMPVMHWWHAYQSGACPPEWLA